MSAAQSIATSILLVTTPVSIVWFFAMRRPQ